LQRRAKDIFFINDQMETHGSKAFFEFRSNLKIAGVKMWVELTDRHLLVSPSISTKEPFISAKEPCISAQEPYISLH